MASETSIVLPTAISKADRVNAQNMVLFGLAKTGKTTALGQLPNCLLIDVEDGSGFIDAVKMKIPEGLGPVARFQWLKDVAKQIRVAGKPYDYVAIDTFSMIDEWSEWVGTYRYMQSGQGKSFNRYNDKDHPNEKAKWGSMLPPDHPDYESVHTLPQGYGYRWSRQEVLDMYETLAGLGRICTIFVCHVADKSIVSKLSNQEVVTRDLALTGKVKDILTRKVDAIGYLYNTDGEAHISFEGNEEKIGGNRAKHLAGFNGPLDWSKVFIKE